MHKHVGRQKECVENIYLIVYWNVPVINEYHTKCWIGLIDHWYWIGLTVIKSMRPVIRIGVNLKKKKKRMHKFNEILVNMSELLPFEHLSQIIWQWTCSSTQTWLHITREIIVIFNVILSFNQVTQLSEFEQRDGKCLICFIILSVINWHVCLWSFYLVIKIW